MQNVGTYSLSPVGSRWPTSMASNSSWHNSTALRVDSRSQPVCSRSRWTKPHDGPMTPARPELQRERAMGAEMDRSAPARPGCGGSPLGLTAWVFSLSLIVASETWRTSRPGVLDLTAWRGVGGCLIVASETWHNSTALRSRTSQPGDTASWSGHFGWSGHVGLDTKTCCDLVVWTVWTVWTSERVSVHPRPGGYA